MRLLAAIYAFELIERSDNGEVRSEAFAKGYANGYDYATRLGGLTPEQYCAKYNAIAQAKHALKVWAGC